MAILGRGITGLPLTADSLIIGVGGVLDELPVGNLNQILTITAGGVDWADPAIGTITGGFNLTVGDGQVFSSVNGNNLEFRALTAGAGITITQNLNDLVIENTAGSAVTSVNGDVGPIVVLDVVDINDVVFALPPANSDVLTFNLSLNQWEAQQPPGSVGGESNTASNIGAGIGVFDSKVSQDLQFRSIIGTNGITATLNVDVIEIDGTSINGTVTSIGIVDSSGGQDLIITGTPITTSGNINVELAIIPSVAGVYTTPANVTVDNKGRITAISDSASIIQNLYETFAADTGFTTANTPTDTLTIVGGSGIASIATPDTITLNLEDSGVIAGTFILPTVTVDLQGRITSISNGTALQNVVEDSTPQLGGNLDVQASKITTSVVDGDIVIQPNGTGLVTAQTGYDMSAGPGEAFASKEYVDTQDASAGIQNLFESVTGDTGTITAASATDTFKIAGAPSSGVTTSVSGNQILIDFTNAALFNVVEDTTPQLGGNLDVQTFMLTTSTLNGDIEFVPNGTGIITGPFGYDVTGEADEVLANKGYVDSQIGGFSTDLEGLSDTNVAGKTTDDLLVFTGTTWDPVSDITLNTLKLKDHGSNGLTWVIEEDAGATNALTFDYNLIERAKLSPAGDLTLTGKIVVPGTTTFNTVAYTWPGSDGSAGQLLTTDGAGNLSFSTVSGGAGTQNIYETISGDTGTPTTANAVNDVLAIVGGTGISTVVSVDTLTINNDITSIDDLSNVDITTVAPTTDDTLVWNGVNFIPTTLRTISTIAGAGGTPFTATSLADTFNIVGDGVSIDTTVSGDTLTISNIADNLGGLIDVDLSAPAPSSGEALVFNGAVWKPQAIGGAQNLWLNIDADTGIATANATGDTLFLTGGTGITTSIVGDVVTFDADIVNIGDLANVSPSAPITNDVLTFTGTQWEPQALPALQNLFEAFTADTGSTTANSATDTLTITGGTNITTAIIGDVLTIDNDLSTLGSLTNTNVLVDTATANDVLTFVGGEWIAQPAPGAQNLYETIAGNTGTTVASTTTDTLNIVGGTGISTIATNDILTINNAISIIDNLNDVDTTTVAPTSGQILEWNGTNWIPVTNTGGTLQNLYETISGDTGTPTTASTVTASLSIVGAASSGISVAITTDTVTIDVNLASSQITVPNIAGATFTTDEDTTNVMLSGGWLAGGAITDNGNGTVAIAIGSATIRATDSSVAQIIFTDWSAVASLTLTDQTNNFVYVEYNAGTPQVISTVSERTDFNTNILLGTVYRDGIVAHINTTKKHVVSDHANQAILRFKETQPFQRASGAVLSETGTRNIAISTGVFWEGLTRFTTAAFDSSTADTFSYWFTDGIGGWNEVSGQSQINNTQYDDAGTLTTLSSNNFGTHYIYTSTDDDVDIIYGTGTFTLQEAMDDVAPGDVPPRVSAHSRLVGKIIIGLNSTTFEQVVSAFVEGIDVFATGLFNVVEDTTPQLGGALDVNNNPIISTANADISITPNGTGAIDLGSMIHEKKNTTAVGVSQTAVFEVYASTFDATYLDYVFQTAGGTRVGTLIIATDGTTVGVADTGTDIGTVSISFTAVINTTNVDVSFTENLAAAGTLTYTSRRMTV